jgi:CubicO group peptidase (beta-lactamase class C family)
MNRLALPLLSIALAIPPYGQAQQEEAYDYWQHQREMVRRGQHAIFMCNGLFTSNRTLEQLYDWELEFFNEPIGDPNGGDYRVHIEERAVEIGVPGAVPIMRAAFREGVGCVIMPPDQNLDDIERLPELTLPYPAEDPRSIPWPDGDLISDASLPSIIDQSALQSASDWAFDRPSDEQQTVSLIVVYEGQIIHERYADGFDMTTRTRTWSTAKSIASTLIGMLVDQGRLELDEPLGFDWLPETRSPETDPRNNITLRHVLNMSSGLETVDNRGLEYAIGSGLSYWAGASSVAGARSRALIREPGTFWDYENYDTLLGVYAMKRALGGEKEYAEFPRKALLDKIGMRNTLVSTDRFGDFVLSSQVYTNARDLARFGLLYLQNGIWNGERLISDEWIDFSRTPAPATESIGNMYGGQWWLVPDSRNDVPKDAYSTSGNRGQYTIVVPTHDLVIVRRGLDYGRQGFDRWGLTREIIKAIE